MAHDGHARAGSTRQGGLHGLLALLVLVATIAWPVGHIGAAHGHERQGASPTVVTSATEPGAAVAADRAHDAGVEACALAVGCSAWALVGSVEVLGAHRAGPFWVGWDPISPQELPWTLLRPPRAAARV